MKDLTKSVTTITVYAVVTRALGFLFRIYLAARIGAILLGVYQVAFSFFAVLLGIVASGVPLTVSAYTARNPLDRHTGGGVCASGLAISSVICAATVLAVLLARVPFVALMSDERSYPVLLLLLPALVFTGMSAPFRGSIWGRKRYAVCSAIELGEQIARIVSCVLIFELTDAFADRAHGAAFSMSVGCAVSGILYVGCYFLDGYRIERPALLADLLRTSTPISTVRVASSAVNLVIALILPARLIAGGMNADQAMRLYGESVGMALGFLFVPLTLTGSLSMALVPELSDGMNAEACDGVRKLCANGLRFAVAVAGLFVPVFAALGVPIGLIFFGSYRCGLFLSEGALVMFPLALEQIASSMMNSLGLEKQAFVNFSVGTAVLLALLWILTPRLGTHALLVAMACSYGISMALHTVVLRQRLSMPLDYFSALGCAAIAESPAYFAARWLYPLLLPVGVVFAALVSAIAAIAVVSAGYLVTGVVRGTALLSHAEKKKNGTRKNKTIRA